MVNNYLIIVNNYLPLQQKPVTRFNPKQVQNSILSFSLYLGISQGCSTTSFSTFHTRIPAGLNNHILQQCLSLHVNEVRKQVRNIKPLS